MSSTKPTTTFGEKMSQGIQKIFDTAGMSNAANKLVDISKNMDKNVPIKDYIFKSYNIDDNTKKTNNNRPNLINIKSVMGLIIVLVIVLFCILFKVPNPFTQNYSKSDQEITNNVFLVLFFIILILGICIALLPSLKELKDLIYQINSVTYIIIYTIFLILFFSLMSKDIIDKYAYIITPITIIAGAGLFYKSLSQNYVEMFNVNYERIKSIILMFCLITIFIIYYNNDPGGYIDKYFGHSLLLTILIAVFAFIYLVIILTLPDKVKATEPGAKTSSFFDNFTGFTKYSSLGFLLFLIIVAITISSSGDFFKNKSSSSASMVLILLICILWSIILGTNLFPEINNNGPVKKDLNLFKRSLLALFSIIISILVIVWITYNISSLTGSGSSTTSFILNISLVILILGLIYKTINVTLPSEKANVKKDAFFSLILNILLYIPCLFSGGFDFVGEKFVGKEKSAETGSILMLVITIILLVVYFNMSYFVNLQGGKLLVNKPVNTDTIYSLGTYQDLNDSDQYDYQYGLSFWVFINSAGANTNPSYGKYTSLLNFGEKPNVLYNGKTNTLLVTMQQKDLNKVTNNKLIDFDENGNRIIYKHENVLLQKWNNIIINYTGGVLDIFLNGELVKSSIGVVPYYTLDSLTIGQENGIKGGICNVVYYKQPLRSSKIYYLYNMSKNNTPPILNTSNVTIIKDKIEKL